ncbi:MAG: hypothetical protein R3C71_01855 [Candidatus Krumholzibacteriia bacterium]
MNMAPLDWIIVAAMLALMGTGIVASRRRMQSVADFLAAGRAAGRYLLRGQRHRGRAPSPSSASSR